MYDFLSYLFSENFIFLFMAFFTINLILTIFFNSCIVMSIILSYSHPYLSNLITIELSSLTTYFSLILCTLISFSL
jgi:hypothetical protein